MKKTLLLSFLIALTLATNAQERQVDYVQLSPKIKIETTIGIVDVKLEYCRPSMRGRKIFGGLETFGEIWRTGANKNTKIIFGSQVLIGNQTLAAGTYTLFTKPNIDIWEVYFHTELDEYGAPDSLDEKNIMASISVPVTKLNRDIETFSISFENITANSANLTIAWERTLIAIPINIPTNNILQERLERERTVLLNDYSTSAYILFEKEKDPKNALTAINQSIELLLNKMSFEEWLAQADLSNRHLSNKHRLKSVILAELGEKEKAIEYAELSLKIAKKGNIEHYINENLGNLKKWKE